ncbi:MAG TPA: YdeI/OmpD-associated family protein [Verrucomicrobiae bacterium]|nr:YdeI/OmpD-associated family protein [Verrucomicrobiae bacterium]
MKNTPETLAGLPIKLFETPKDWESWLNENHPEPTGLWLKIAKKASGKRSVSYLEALDVALCFGWIDGQKQSYDAEYFLQKFTPRRAKSTWSKVNVENIARLTAAGLMQAPGLAAVEAAKADGRWDQAYDSSRTMEMPEEFRLALDAHPKAKAFFSTLNKANTYAILWRVQTAKKPETRQARIEKLIAMLEAGEKLH